MSTAALGSRTRVARFALPFPGIVVALLLAVVLPLLAGELGLSQGRALKLCGGVALAVRMLQTLLLTSEQALIGV